MTLDTKVLVSGASGYVGGHVVKTLLSRGYAVRGTVRSTSKVDKIAHLQKLIDDGERLELVEADLLKPETWPPAISGCTYVCHVASPFVFDVRPEEEEKLIKPAVEGTKNVLIPCKADKDVKKVVLVSSVVSIMAGWEKPCEGRIVEPEQKWSVPEKCDPYSKSKTLAEKAAWDLVKDSDTLGSLDLAVINPSLVIGPTLSPNVGTSLEIASQILDRKMPATPLLCLNVVDVRDVAEAIVRAMEKPEATGERFVISQTGVWLNDLSQAARPIFQPLGYNPPNSNIPTPLLKILSWVIPSLRSYASNAGRFYELDNSKAKNVLNMDFMRYQESFVDMCHSVIQYGIVKKTDKYKTWEKEQASS